MDFALNDLRAVFDAAENLLCARESATVNGQQWEGLRIAVDIAREAATTRLESFRVERGRLVRHVVPAQGVPYLQRCSEPDFKAIAVAIAGRGSAPFVVGDLCRLAGVGRAAALVTLVFLKARGLVIEAEQGKHAAAGFSIEAAVAAYDRLALQA